MEIKFKLKRDIILEGKVLYAEGDIIDVYTQPDGVYPIVSYPGGHIHLFIRSLAEMDEWFEKIGKESTKKKVTITEKQKTVWELKPGDTCYVINIYGRHLVEPITWDDNHRSFLARELGYIFIDEQKAFDTSERLRALSSINQFIHKNNLEFEPDWEDTLQIKYYIFSDMNRKKFGSWSTSSLSQASVLPVFSKDEDAQKVIKNCKPALEVIFNIK